MYVGLCLLGRVRVWFVCVVVCARSCVCDCAVYGGRECMVMDVFLRVVCLCVCLCVCSCSCVCRTLYICVRGNFCVSVCVLFVCVCLHMCVCALMCVGLCVVSV